MAGNILLIGFMGVGKGRVARALAGKTGVVAVDTDDLIESMTNRKIRSIFTVDGEPFFRQLEQRTSEWLRCNVRNTIVATGGGFFHALQRGEGDAVVFLHAPLEVILQAIHDHPRGRKKIKKRPLLGDINKARELYAKRLPLYRKAADVEIGVEGLEAEAIADRIMLKLGLTPGEETSRA
ncbi:MAG: shikimate kinase [Desulfobulbaceae bacterium]